MDENLSKQILAIGFPSVRIMLYALAKHFNKENVESRIEEVCHIQDIGCFNIDYYNKETDKKDTVLIFLKECGADHNLSDQLNKLRPYLDDEKWKNILKTLSYLILLTRNIYVSIYDNNKELIEEIVGINNIETYNKLNVDPDNTTLYLPNIEDRVGIFFENA